MSSRNQWDHVQLLTFLSVLVLTVFVNNVSDYNNRNVVINFTPSIPYSLNFTKLSTSCIHCTYNSAWRNLIKIGIHPCFYGVVINKAKNGKNYKIIEKSYS